MEQQVNKKKTRHFVKARERVSGSDPAYAKSLTEQIFEAFSSGELPPEEWSHEAHMQVGLWYLLNHTTDEAMQRLRQGIIDYNHACGIANTESSGYHETVTRFYCAIIAHFLKSQDRSRPVDELAQRLVDQYGEKRLPLKYYSKELLRSPKARLEWVEPDLRPIPDVFLGG